MILTAHQPNYLPYPGFFQKIAAADQFLVVDTTQFVKRGPFGWIHRNRIRTPNGPIWLSLPVRHRGRYHQSIQEAELIPGHGWRRKHWKSIEWNYSKAPHWPCYAESLREIYLKEWTHLSPLTTEFIRWFLRVLELPVPVQLASELEAKGKSSQYIVEFCKELEADTFLSGVHGRDYLDVDLFSGSGIRLLFQHYEPPRYCGGQDATEIENLSMLDMLFWRGPEAVAWVHEIPDALRA